MRTLLHWANQHSGWFFLAGFLAVILRQAHLWQRDKERLAHLQASPPLPALETWPRLPKVSVLVAGWDEAANIQDHIHSFLALRYPHKQLVLVAGGTDGTFELAQACASHPVIVIRQVPGEGKQRALRRGFDLTDGDVIYLTDADCLLDDQSFESVLYPLACGQERAVSGTQRPSTHHIRHPFVFSQASSQIYANYHRPAHAPGLQGCNCAIERDSLLYSGGLQFDTPTGTDYVLAKMLTSVGIPIRQLPSSQVTSAFPTTFHAYYRQQARWLGNVVRLGRQFDAHAEVRSIYLNSLSGLGMLLAPLFSLLLGPLVLAAWGVLLVYGLASRLRYAAFTLDLTHAPLNSTYWLTIPCYLALDFVVWAASLPSFFQRHAGW